MSRAPWGVAGGLVLVGIGLAIYVQSAFPAQRPSLPIAREPASNAVIAELKPPKRVRPLVAVVALNSGTETTDFLIPISVLRRSGAADVVSVAVTAGAVQLMPALRVEADRTLSSFDAEHPDGADIVIVPAVHDSRNAAVIAWVKAQAAKGALIASICEGANVVANAGLLDGKRATTHWYRLVGLIAEHPKITAARDARYVVDRGVASTTGVSASVPFSLALVAAIAGREKADAIAAEFGEKYWGPSHRSANFVATRGDAWVTIWGWANIWRRDMISLQISQGVDEAALGLVADAYGRTGRAQVQAAAASGQNVSSLNGVVFLPEADVKDVARPLITIVGATPMANLQAALKDVQTRYGPGVADLVRLQLEMQ